MPFTKGHKINVGRKFSLETIEKMRTTPNSGQFKKGIVPWSKSQKGIHLSPESEFKKGMTPWNKGKHYKSKPCSEERKRKIGEAQKGEKNHMYGKREEETPNWKGGVTPLMMKIRGHFYSKDWRKSVFERDDYTCQNKECNIRGGKLEADHIKPFVHIYYENNIKTLEEALNCKEFWNIDNGRTYCKECHYKLGFRGSWIIK